MYIYSDMSESEPQTPPLPVNPPESLRNQSPPISETTESSQVINAIKETPQNLERLMRPLEYYTPEQNKIDQQKSAEHIEKMKEGMKKRDEEIHALVEDSFSQYKKILKPEKNVQQSDQIRQKRQEQRERRRQGQLRRYGKEDEK